MTNIQNDSGSAVDALVKIVDQSKPFITCESGNHYKVVAQFKTLSEAQNFYTALNDLLISQLTSADKEMKDLTKGKA